MEHLDEGRIHAWLDGALADADAAAVAEHVIGCETCAAAVAEARGLIAAASRIVSALDDVPAGVIPRGMPAATARDAAVVPIQDQAARTANRSRGDAWWRRSGIAAAALLFVATGSVFVTRDGVNEVAYSMDSTAAAGGPSAPSTEAVPPVAPPQDAVAQDMAPKRELSRALPAPQTTMSAPASSPAASAPAVATSPVIAATPPVLTGSSLSGAGGAGAGSVTSAQVGAAARGAAEVAAATSRLEQRVVARNDLRSADTSAVARNATRADAMLAKAAANGAASATVPPTASGARAFRDEARPVSAPAAPRAPGDGVNRGVTVAPLVGCYAVNELPLEISASSRARNQAVVALAALSRTRLSDTLARAGGEWLIARTLDRAKPGSEFQWRPLSRDELQLRAVVAAETSMVRLKIASGVEPGVARRIGC